MSGSVKLKGIQDLKKKFAKLTAKAQTKVGRQGLAEAAKTFRKEIRSRAPKDSGNLRKNIRYRIRRKRRGHFQGRVGVTGAAFYARFIEYGASPHRIPNETTGRGRNKQKNKAKVAFNGAVYGAVDHPGVTAKPFIRPAFDAAARKAIDAAKKKLWEGIKREAK